MSLLARGALSLVHATVVAGELVETQLRVNTELGTCSREEIDGFAVKKQKQ